MSSSEKDFDNELPMVARENGDAPDAKGNGGDGGTSPATEELPEIVVRQSDGTTRRPNIDPLRLFRRIQRAPRTRAATVRRNKLLIGASVALVAMAGAAVAAPFLWLKLNKLPDIRALETYAPVQSVRIYDRFDKLAAVINGEEDRRPIKLSQVSPNMRLAMIGAEDHDFYHHGGINPSSIMRAAIANFQAGRIVEGGSTITQQLVKNLFFPGEKRNYNRKIKEFFLANQVAQKYTRDKILEMYLNQIYFGNQSYGIEAAAQRYFGKSATHLTMGEATFLAGLVRAPSFLSNPAHREQAFARQHQVIDQMIGYGMLTKQQGAAAKEEKLAFRKYVNPYSKYPFYVSYVMDELRDHYGEQEMQHGLNVYTCLDPAAQLKAEQTINDGIAHAPAGVTQGALVSLKVADAGVIAMVGGAGRFENHQWNRAVSPHTMGSSFKPFVYLTGFLKGLTPESTVLDSPFSAPSGGQYYTPRNFDNRFFGPMTVKNALTQSRNVCAVRIAWFCGIKNVINTAHLAGLTSKLDPYLPTAIGACAASPLEMAGAYSTFARGGVALTPHLVRKIVSPNGKVVYAYDEAPRKVFDSAAVSELIECMENVVEHGTGLYARLPGRQVAGKTGTADKSRDIWFIGFTPDTVTATWGGNDHNQAIGNRAVTGGMVMAGMWNKFMTAYYQIHPTPPTHFMIASNDTSAIALDKDDASKALSKGITPIKPQVTNTNQQDNKATANSNTTGTSSSADNGTTASATANPASGNSTDNAAGTDKNGTANGTAGGGAVAQNDDSTDSKKPAKSKRSRKLIARKAEPKEADTATNKEPAAHDAKAPDSEAAPAAEEKKEAGEPAEEKKEAAPVAEKLPAPAPVRRQQSAPRAILYRLPNGRLMMVPVRERAPMAAPAPAPAPVTAAPAGAPANEDDGED